MSNALILYQGNNRYYRENENLSYQSHTGICEYRSVYYSNVAIVYSMIH